MREKKKRQIEIVSSLKKDQPNLLEVDAITKAA